MLIRLRQNVARRAVALIQRFTAKQVSVAGRSFRVTGEVFNPGPFLTSELLAAHLHVAPGETVLDLGTGSGVQAIVAAATAARVVAVDVNPAAVACARDNCRLNGVDNVTVLEGDLFAPVEAERFDLICFNPPYLEGEPRNRLEQALCDPGGRLLARFLREAADHLTADGRVVMAYSTIAGDERVASLLGADGWRVEEVARQANLFETLLVVELRPLGARLAR